MATTPSLAEVIKSGIERKLAGTYVARPARVERFDASKCLADVKPLLKESAEDDEGNPVSVSLPVISNVPVVFPGAGGFRNTFPVSKGDTVLLVFSDRSLDRWISQGGEIDPVEDARHSLSDAVAIPGLNAVTDAWSGVSSDAMTLGKDGGAQIQIKAAEIDLGLAAVDAAVKGTTYRAAENVLFTAIGAFATAVGAALAPTSGAAATLNAAIGTFQAASAAYLSSLVKVQ